MRNHEARVIFLRALAARIEQERLNVLASPPGRDTAARDRLLAKVDRWEEQLAGFQKRAKSDLHFAGVQTNWGRGDYAARQSFRDRSRNAEGLRAAAAALSASIAELLAALDPDSLAWKHLIESFEKIVKEAGDGTTLDAVQTRELQQIIEQAAPGSAPPSPGAPGGPPVMSLLTFALALFAILKRMRD